MDFKKTCAFAVVAIFCLTAFVSLAAADDSDAFDIYTDYDIYLQLNNGDSKYNGWLPTQQVVAASTTDYSKANFATAINAGAAAEGMSVELTATGWVKSVTIKGVTYEKKGTYGTEGYYGFSVYYLKDGTTWTSCVNLTEGGIIAIVLDEYLLSEPTKNKDKYYNTGYEWVLLPDVKTVDYKIYLQLNDGEHTFSKWLPTVSALNISKFSMSKAVKEACEKAGIETDYADGFATTFKADGVTYTSTYSAIWPPTGDYYNYAQFYKKSDSEWGLISSYTESSVVAITFDKYLFAEPTENKDKYMMDEMMGDWVRLPDAKPSDADAKDNTILYIGAGAAAVIIIAILAFVLIRRRA